MPVNLGADNLTHKSEVFQKLWLLIAVQEQLFVWAFIAHRCTDHSGLTLTKKTNMHHCLEETDSAIFPPLHPFQREGVYSNRIESEGVPQSLSSC